ncbi:FAD-binding oxidoreductase [Nocardia terpenica]|uniref:FAD-binding protein n=1 Tax=Nocardia terpenica TaxID=455432 RepID=A0A6G9YUQ8_9NOCA|nr:FAD-binding oxidoreductase [Nocardia terpenica]QIS16954.1 FAD-binding protein [Nocardia terpenica]
MHDIEELRDTVRGQVILPGQHDYDTEKSGFNTLVDRAPAVIVGAAHADDVRAAVTFAAGKSLPVGVQATGHGMPASAEGGVLITTHRMDAVRIDPRRRTAWFEAGVRWGQVIGAAAEAGLAPLNGSAPQVGAVGYTLAGGIGPLARRYGYAADHVRSIDVVTADGRHRHITATTDPDLFWALRGGRDNFGVVTSMEVDLVPVRRLYGGGLYFDAEHAADVLHAWRNWTRTVPAEMTSSIALYPLPLLPVVPEPIRGRNVAHIRIAYTGTDDEGNRLLAPLRAAGTVLMDTVADIPYTDVGTIHNDPATPMPRNYDTALLRDLEPTAEQAILDAARPGPEPHVIEVRHLGGALADPPATPNAIGHRDARYLLVMAFLLRDQHTTDIQPVRTRLLNALAPQTLGRAPAFLGLAEHATPEQVRTAYQPADHARLTELKTIYDPTNMFSLNHNIPPSP